VVDGDTERDTPEPYAEFRRVYEEVQIAERSQECVLDDIIDVRRPNERHGERVHHAPVPSYQFAERVAGRRDGSPRLDDEIRVGSLGR
jgi:hypothetical protein